MDYTVLHCCHNQNIRRLNKHYFDPLRLNFNAKKQHKCVHLKPHEISINHNKNLKTENLKML